MHKSGTDLKVLIAPSWILWMSIYTPPHRHLRSLCKFTVIVINMVRGSGRRGRGREHYCGHSVLLLFCQKIFGDCWKRDGEG